MPHRCLLTMTPLADAFARAKASVDDVLHAAIDEIDSFCPADEQPNGIFTFTVGGQLFIAWGNGDGNVLIDTATYEEGPLMTAGPFKGKRLVMPKGDSEED